MDEFIEEMAELYRKIQDGSADNEVQMTFEIKLQLSCMNRGVLMHLIENAVREKITERERNNG